MKARSITALCASLLLALPATAAVVQDPTFEKRAPSFVYVQDEGMKHATFVATELAFDGKVVKNAPYSAEASSDSIHTLADGNRIVRSSTTKIYRDSQGRTRREQSLRSIGPFAAATGAESVVIIHDPVNSVTAILNPEKRTARKLPAPGIFVKSGSKGGKTVERKEEVVVLERRAAEEAERAETERRVERRTTVVKPDGTEEVDVTVETTGPNTFVIGAPGVEGGVQFHVASADDAKTEQLGKKSFGAVEADGTRTTTTIPAGKIGNERPIEIVFERWYSPELETVVYSRHYDPRFGETIYELKNISRDEPAPSLFEIPEGFKIEEHAFPNSFVFTTQTKSPKVIKKH